ncbi:tetratricopeptide repeat protein, partial [Patescibacteria group bacterium]|nr:tetratricopeptide repeat protein [Patescibacteria group bacterium]
RVGAQILGSYYQQLGKERANAIMGVIYPGLQKNLDLHPFDIRNQLTMAQLDQTSAMINNDPKYIVEAENLLENALIQSPRRQQILYSLSSIKLQLGKPEEAIRLLEQAMSDNPKIAESYWRLAFTYQSMGDNKKAREIIALAEENNIVFDANGQRVVDAILATSTPTDMKK